jgi:hypothetical protein
MYPLLNKNLPDIKPLIPFTEETGKVGNTDDYGGKYITLTASGIKEEGNPFDCYYTSEKNCIIQYSIHLVLFLQDRRHIVWRIIPELVTLKVKESVSVYLNVYQIYSRLTAYPRKL